MNQAKKYRLWRSIPFIVLFLAFVIMAYITYDLKGTSDELKSQISMQVETIEKLSAKVDSNKIINEELKMSLEIKSKELDTLASSNNKLKEQNNTLTVQNEELKKSNSNLESRINSLREQMKDIKAKSKQTVSVSRGTTAPKGKAINVEATAYTAYCSGCSGTTATGINLRENPALKVIAVDPKVIPLGSKVYVEGYGYALAGDTGGAIKGNKVDLFMPNKSDAYKWGRRNVTVTILW